MSRLCLKNSLTAFSDLDFELFLPRIDEWCKLAFIFLELTVQNPSLVLHSYASLYLMGIPLPSG
jgi:hypothetical protein